MEAIKICEKKVSQSRNNVHKKILVKGETRTHVLKKASLTSWKQKSFSMVKTEFFDTPWSEQINSSCL